MKIYTGKFSNIEGRSATQRERISKNNMISFTGSWDSIKLHILKESSKYLIFGITSVDFYSPALLIELYNILKPPLNFQEILTKIHKFDEKSFAQGFFLCRISASQKPFRLKQGWAGYFIRPELRLDIRWKNWPDSWISFQHNYLII